MNYQSIKERVKSFNDDPQLMGVVMYVQECNLLIDTIEKMKTALEWHAAEETHYGDKARKALESIKEVEKPPVGIAPWRIADELRLNDIVQAIIRFRKANRPIPKEWYEERNEILQRLGRLANE